MTLEELEPRHAPAALDVAGGSLTVTDVGPVYEPNSLTVAVAAGVYSLNDSLAVIGLGDGAVAAGWKGDGTHTVSGPESSVGSITVGVGGGTNAVNLRSLHHPTAVGGGGTTTVTLNSVAPLAIGSLAGITAPVAVNAGADTRLVASDFGGTARPGPVVISPSGVTGLAAFPIAVAGTLAVLTVSTSNAAGLPEAVAVDGSPAADARVLTNGGSDLVDVVGSFAGQVALGPGDDFLVVAAGATLEGGASGGPGVDTFLVGGPLFGDATGPVTP